MLKIGYFADGPWGHNAFERLIRDRDISIQFLCVRFDSVDQKFVDYSREFGIPLLRHQNVNSPEFLTTVASFNCDLLVSMSFNQIFKKEIINLTPRKIINCHAGLLPSYRGRNILNWALINDEKEFGITVHFVDESIDTGSIILQRTFEISDADNYQTLLEKAYVECPSILCDAIDLFKDGRIIPVREQSDTGHSNFYCGRRGPGDEIINWNQTSRELFNFIRAVCAPGPVATSFLRDGTKVQINTSRHIPGLRSYKGFAGQILEKIGGGFLVKTADTYIEIQDIVSERRLRVGERFFESNLEFKISRGELKSI